jgi:hypothetical protein
MPKEKTRREKLDILCQLISNLDGIRAFRRIEPELIKEDFQNLGSGEFIQMWKKIRYDVEKIAYMPMEIKGLPKLIRAVAFLRLLTPMLLILMIVVLVYQLLYIRIFPQFRAILGSWAAAVTSVTLSSFAIITLVTIDYTIRRRVIKYEEKHIEKFSEGRERIKNVIQKLIAELREELKRSNEDPNKYKMILFYKYDGLKVIKESRGRILRKYPLYEVVCST